MRINTNVNALNTLRNLNASEKSVADSTAKLSSGFRINKASDDAAGLAIANKLRNTGAALTQASRNAEQAASMLQIADGATQTITSIVDRMKQLAAAAASATAGSGTDDQRPKLQAEFTALNDEIDRIVSTTKFQGVSLLAGGAGTMDFLVGASGDPSGNDLLKIDFSTGISGLAASDISTQAAAQTAMTDLDTKLDDINTFVGNLGAAESRISFAQENLASTIQNTAAAESTIRDVDMAAEMANFTKAQILQTAGTAMLAQANQNGQSVLRLFQ